MENMNNFENYSAAIDLPDSRDYTSEEVFGEVGGSVELPSSFMLDKAPLLNQGQIGACTLFGSLNAYNEKIKHAHDELSAITEEQAWAAWNECKGRGASDTRGWIFQSALQVLKDLNYIGAYVHLNTRQHANLQKMKEAIFLRKSGVATGLNSVNWTKTLQNREYTQGNYDGQGAHIFDIVGWDDKKILPSGKVGAFYVANSWIPDGHFWIPYADIEDLYSQYEFLLTTEQEKFVEAKKKRKNAYLQKAFEKKIWNEERPADAVTGAEVRIMMNRALGLADDYQWTRKALQVLATDKISRGKVLIAQTGRDWEIASDYELNLIVQRHITRNPSLNAEVITREQMAEVVGRDFL